MLAATLIFELPAWVAPSIIDTDPDGAINILEKKKVRNRRVRRLLFRIKDKRPVLCAANVMEPGGGRICTELWGCAQHGG